MADKRCIVKSFKEGTMKVNDLIRILRSFPGNSVAFVASDAEGNEINRISEVSKETTSDDGEEVGVIIWPCHR